MMDTNNKTVQIGLKLSAITLGLFALFLISKTITEIISWDESNGVYPSRTITINAEGEAIATSDIAEFTFSVNETADTSEEAQSKAEAKIAKAIEYLKQSGVEDKDIKTQGYNIYPKYESVAPCYAFDCPPPQNKVVGYEVSQNIMVKVREVENAGKFLAELTKFEINNISGLTFTIDDEENLYEEARKDAISKAQEKAETLAKNLGVELGDVISFSEDMQGGYYGGDNYMRSEAMSAPKIANVSLPTGENKYTTRVYVTYELE